MYNKIYILLHCKKLFIKIETFIKSYWNMVSFLRKKVFSSFVYKRFVVSEINYNSQIAEISPNPFDYTCLKPDIKYENYFLLLKSTSITGVGNIPDIYLNIK